MKTILLVCHHSSIDTPLRRSLTHLTQSCQIQIVASGHQALTELKARAFDLVIIDSQISDLDSLELVESATYLDPDVPLILMLSTAHRSLVDPARALKANPIIRPFKPLNFLRLIDTLLHQHLERYRELSRLLQQTLKTLEQQSQAQHVFLVDAANQTLAFATEPESDSLNWLVNLAIEKIKGTNDDKSEKIEEMSSNDVVDQLRSKVMNDVSEELSEALFIKTITDDLYLVLTLSATELQADSAETWPYIEQAVGEIRRALQERVLSSQVLLSDEADYSVDDVAATQIYISPKQTNLPSPEPMELLGVQEPMPVNWQLIAETPNLLDRLRDYC